MIPANLAPVPTQRFSIPEAEILATNLGFSRYILGLTNYEWAERIMVDADRPGAISVRAANGVGKTTRIAAPLAMCHAATIPGSLCVITSAVFKQVRDQMFPAIRFYAPQFRNWKFTQTSVTTHKGSRIVGVTATDPGKFEGYHNDNLMVIMDEAKSINEANFDAVERMHPKWLILLSSPGAATGRFYDSFNRHRKFYRQHIVKAKDCAHIKPEWIQQQIEKYGEHNQLVRSMIFAEFMTDGEDGSAIPLRIVEELIDANRNGKPISMVDKTDDTHAFCDFAAGRAENVLAIRRANQVEIFAAWRETNTASAAGRFMRYFEKAGLRPGQISADEGGGGHNFCDLFDESKWPVNRVNNGSPAEDDGHYFNFDAETWLEGRLQFERKEIILGPDLRNDREFVAQICTRLAKPDSKGRMRLETKEDMARRGLVSPDKADAVLGCMRRSPGAGGQFRTVTPMNRERIERPERGHVLI